MSVTNGLRVRVATIEAARNQVPLRSAATSLISLTVAVFLTGLLIWALGANPLQAYQGLLSGALGSGYNIGLTLMVATPLTLTGLAAAIPFSARLWNVGGEGQFYAGAVASVLVALTFVHLPAPILAALAVVCGILAGAAWGMIAGLLRILVDANEVIVTLMLNFIALDAADYVITGPWAQNVSPQTRNIPKGVTLPTIWPGTTVNLGLVLALLLAVLAFVLMRHTPLGLSIRATGFNTKAARLAGFSIARITLVAFGAAGACAGLAGAIEVVGVYHALVPDLSASYGYIGIAVALLARLSPLWIIPSAVFFAAVTVGGNNLTATSGISPSTSLIIEAVFIILLLTFHVIRLQRSRAL
jgi:simple sugar transport system permease protein